MTRIINSRVMLPDGQQERHSLKLAFVMGILFLTALACNIPGGGGTPPPDGSIGTIQKEFSDVLQNAVQVESKNPLKQDDELRVQNGGVGLLEFGQDLRLRLFNETMAGEIVATHMESVPNSPLIVRLALFAGGFSGQLYKPGSKATFTTPGGAQIVVLGTDFFVVYDPDSKITTVGNFSGTMGVIAGGESVSLASGHFLEIPREGTPGEQQQLSFSFNEFEDRARSRKSPILALRDDSGTPVAQVSPTITSNAFETDTDQDGLVDGDESPPCPDPNDPDTDGDGFIDGKDLEPCDANNPALTLTAKALTPVVTPVTPVPPTTQAPTDALTPTYTDTPDVETVVVPDILGLSLDTAMSVITGAGLQIGRVVERQLAGQEPDTIFSQSPPAGEVVNKASTVDLVVTSPEEPSVVPDVMGWLHEEAVEAINAAGFQVQINEQSVYLPEPGMIIDQDPPGGESAPPGSIVNLYVSVAPEGSALLFDGVDDFVRIFDSGIYYAYNWFDNETTEPIPTEEPNPAQIPPVGVPTIEVLSVYKDESINARVFNLPPGVQIVLTIGPMNTRGIGGIFVDSFETGSDGTYLETFRIPSELHGEAQISIRIESTPIVHFNFDKSFTIEAWIKPTSLAGEAGLKGIVVGALSEPHEEPEGEYAIFMNESDDSDWGLAVCVSCPPGSKECIDRCGTTTSGPEGLQVDQWQHVAGIYNGDEIITYWNGREISRQDHTGDVADIEFLIIGTALATFNGYIDEVLVWNTARTPTQIMDDMNQRVNVQEAGLVGYWRFDEGSGQVVFDSSPQRNHGRLGSNVEDDQYDPTWISFSKIPR